MIGGFVLFFFFLSGCSGLIYEVVWTRLLRHVMGNTVFSMTTVLCAFMGGLALGSYLAGRIIDRRGHPLLLYAVMEGAIGLYCLSLPVLVEAIEPLYRYIYQNYQTSLLTFALIRFLLCAMILLPPATLMGATLPVLTKFFARSLDRVGGSIGRLYAINTFGAVLGAFGTGFLLIPSLGTSRSLYLGCLVSFAICLLAYALYRRSLTAQAGPEGRAKAAEPGEAATTPGGAGVYGRAAGIVLLVGYGLSGLAALAYEIAWSRALSLLIGSSVYAFSLMLTAFILGLAIGSAIYGRFADRSRDPLRAMGIVEVAIGFSALAVVPLFGWLPFFVTGMISRISASFWLLQLAEFGLLFVIMTVPTILMGAAFPLAIRIYTRSTASVGRSVGTVYSINTLGSILGAFAGGFILLPLLGIQKMILAVVLINIVVGCAFLAFSNTLTAKLKGVLAAAVLLVAATSCGLVPQWDQARMTFGAFIQARRLSKEDARSRSALERISKEAKVIFHEEGICTTVTVKQYPSGDRVLYVDGKPDASTTADLPTQILSAHATMLMHPDPRRVCVIGLASGITLGSAGLHPEVETLDCVEISPAMEEACRLFDEYNHHILDDPRVRIILEDGRTHLALTAEEYDVIISEPSNAWIAGIGDLFTQEFYEICRDRLGPGGMMCSWLENYNIDEDAFRSIVHTFYGVFPRMTIWNPPETADFLLIGTKGTLELDYETLSQRLAEENVLKDLRRIGVKNAVDLLSHVLLSERSVRRLARGARLHTDDNALLEFTAPRSMFGPGGSIAGYGDLKRYRDYDLPFLTCAGGEPGKLEAIRSSVEKIAMARQSLAKGLALVRQGEEPMAVPYFAEAVRLDPSNADAHFNLGIALGRQGRSREAVEQLVMAVEIDPHHGGANDRLGGIRTQQHRFEEAARHYRNVLAGNPASQDARHKLGRVLMRMNDVDEAIEAFREVLRQNPEHAEARSGLKEALAKRGQPGGLGADG